MQGGKFGAGFLSGGVAAFAGGTVLKDLSKAGQLVARSVIGGLSAELGGGKFQNGAVTAAFGYLFNELAHELKEQRFFTGERLELAVNIGPGSGCSTDISPGPCGVGGGGFGGGGGISGRTIAVTPNGRAISIPEGWIARPADNGKGIVYQRPDATGNVDSIRIMDPTPTYPQGYLRYYNRSGQPLDVDGRPGNRGSTHIPLDYEGTIRGLP